jgi:hypothetical protein
VVENQPREKVGIGMRGFGFNFMKQNDNSNLQTKYSYAQSSKHPPGSPNRRAQILGEVHIAIPYMNLSNQRVEISLVQSYFIMGILGMQE